MPLEAPLAPLDERVADLNARFAHHGAHDVLSYALTDPLIGPTALVSSFGAESVVLLHMVSTIDRTTPVLFVDTEMLFPETLAYQRNLAGKLRLSTVQIIRPDRDETFLEDGENGLHRTNPDACCDLRKTRPLNRALAHFGAWVTGRKRYQGGQRVSLDVFEADDAGRIKVNPLAHFAAEDVSDYIGNNRLPRHPLAMRGYPSIGCAPCTTRVADGEDIRAGRWRGHDKSECGIHFANSPAPRTAGKER